MSEQPHDPADRRHELARVERFVQEGWSQSEIETALGDRGQKESSVARILRRVFNVEARKAA